MLQRNHLFLNTQHKYSVYVLLSFFFLFFLFFFFFWGGGGVSSGIKGYQDTTKASTIERLDYQFSIL